MTIGDIDLGLRLRNQAGWNQTPVDWKRFLDLAPDGCFVAESGGVAVGTTTACLFGTVGWIAMVLVEQSARNAGIGTRLVEHAIADLFTRGARTIRLDATSHGEKVYRKLGFSPDYELVRMQGGSHPSYADSVFVERAGACDLSAISDLDQAVTGTPRRRLLERLLVEDPARCCCISRDHEVTGYAMWRPGAHAAALGPVIAENPIDAVCLLDWLLRQCRGQRIFVDMPSQNTAAIQWAASRGLEVQRHFLRMHLGLPVNDCPNLIWASSGPEKG